MAHGLRILLKGAAIAYIVICAALFLFQRSFIYFPQPGSGGDGATLMPLPTSEARVLVSTRPKDGPRALIYFGGNAEDVSFAMPDLSTAFPDSALYLLHYRGFGGSSGKPSEDVLFADALTLFDQVRAKHPNIDVVGRSLGSAIAVYVASRRPATHLILVTPYDSLADLAAVHFPYVPAKWLLLDKFESWRYAPAVTAPTLILAAEHDEIVPRASTELLLTRFRRGLASLKTILGTGHNTISDNVGYVQALRELP